MTGDISSGGLARRTVVRFVRFANLSLFFTPERVKHRMKEIIRQRHQELRCVSFKLSRFLGFANPVWRVRNPCAAANDMDSGLANCTRARNDDEVFRAHLIATIS